MKYKLVGFFFFPLGSWMVVRKPIYTQCFCRAPPVRGEASGACPQVSLQGLFMSRGSREAASTLVVVFPHWHEGRKALG